jgi:hypothetical protein
MRISTGGFGFTLSFGTLHRDVAFGVVYTPGLGSAGLGLAPAIDLVLRSAHEAGKYLESE